VMSRLHSDVHREVRKCEEEGMGDPIAGCRRYVGLVRGENDAEESSTWWEGGLMKMVSPRSCGR
jgi:hypothetical protein